MSSTISKVVLNPWRVQIVKLFGEMLDKSGLIASIQSQCQRLACVIEGSCLEHEPPVGTPLLVDLFGVVEHSGIYLGNGQVAELYGDGLLQKVSLKDFLNGAGGTKIRTGRRIFAACSAESKCPVSSEFARENAQAYIRQYRTVSYSLFRNNCHLFSISCFTGQFLNKEGIPLKDLFMNGGVSVAVLTYAIQHYLNADQRVIWMPVKGWHINEMEGKERQISDPATELDTEKVYEKTIKENAKGLLKGEDTEVNVEKFEKKLNEKHLTDKIQKARTGVIAPCFEMIKFSYSIVRDQIKGRRSDIPWSIVSFVLGALIYFLSPVDLIPDALPVVGYADDALVYLCALKKLLTFVSLPLNIVGMIMHVKEDVKNAVDRICEKAKRAEECNRSACNRTFCVRADLIPYLEEKFELHSPIKREVGFLDGRFSNWSEVRSSHEWKIESSGRSWRLVDPSSKSYVYGTKEEVSRAFDKFMSWYDNVLIPRIVDEKV